MFKLLGLQKQKVYQVQKIGNSEILMESIYSSSRSKDRLQNTLQTSYLNNSPHASSPMSLVSSSSSAKIDKPSTRNNRILDRIRTQLTNIKSEVFKMTKDHNSPTRSVDKFQLEKSVQKEVKRPKIESRSPTEPFENQLSDYQRENEQLKKSCEHLKAKLYETEQRHKNQAFQLTNALMELEKQLIEKDRKFEEYENDVQEELQRFKQEVITHSDADRLKKQIYGLQISLDDMNNQLIYLRKRTADDATDIRRYTIQNHELKKHSEMLQSLNQRQGAEKLLQETIKELTFQLQKYKIQNSSKKVETGELEELHRLKENNQFASQELALQQNTIEVLESELSKAIKQNKKIETRNHQELKNAKITYEKLLESVKQGLSQCYKNGIDNLRLQLSQYTSMTNSNGEGNPEYHHLPPPPSRMEPKLVTEITSEIIILEENESMEDTDRKEFISEEKASSNTTAREELRNRVEYLEAVIQGLEQQVEQLRWNKDTAAQSDLNQVKNNQLIEKIKQIEQERDSLFYQSIVKQYTVDLQDTLISSVVEEQLLNKKSLESISSQMQFVIEKLKIRNYDIEKKLKENEQTIKNKNSLIEELRNCLIELKEKNQQDEEANEKIIDKIQALEEENERLISLKDVQKRRSSDKLKEVNDQILQLNNYKSALQTEITKREDKISSLKEEITNIVEEEDKKRNSLKMIQDRKNNRVDENIQKQLQIQADYFHKIIQDLSEQLNQLKNTSGKRYSEPSKDLLAEIKKLKSELSKKNQQIYQIKNQTAVSRLRCDSLKSEQEVEKIHWLTEKKNMQIKLQRQIQNLMRDLCLQKQTVEFLTAQLKSLENQIYQKDDIINKVFSKKKNINEIQNVPLESQDQLKKLSEDRNNILPYVVRSLEQQKKSVKLKSNKSGIEASRMNPLDLQK